MLVDLSSGGRATYVFTTPPAPVAGDADVVAELGAALAAESGLELLSLHRSAADAKARAYALARQHTGKRALLACRGTAAEAGARLISHGDGLQARSAMDKEQAAAFVVEVVQVAGGVRVPPPSYFERVRGYCDELGTLLVIDETEVGLGRTGTVLAVQKEGIEPDLLTLSLEVAPGLSGGALLARKQLGLPTAPPELDAKVAAQALAVLREVRSPERLAQVKRCAKILQKGVVEILETRRRWSMDTRGRGMVRTLVLWDDPRLVVKACAERGLTIAALNDSALLLAPPLDCSEADLEETLGVLDSVLATL